MFDMRVPSAPCIPVAMIIDQTVPVVPSAPAVPAAGTGTSTGADAVPSAGTTTTTTQPPNPAQNAGASAPLPAQDSSATTSLAQNGQNSQGSQTQTAGSSTSTVPGTSANRGRLAVPRTVPLPLAEVSRSRVGGGSGNGSGNENSTPNTGNGTSPGSREFNTPAGSDDGNGTAGRGLTADNSEGTYPATGMHGSGSSSGAPTDGYVSIRVRDHEGEKRQGEEGKDADVTLQRNNTVHAQSSRKTHPSRERERERGRRNELVSPPLGLELELGRGNFDTRIDFDCLDLDRYSRSRENSDDA